MYVYYLHFYFYLIPTLNQGITRPQNSYPLSLHPLYLEQNISKHKLDRSDKKPNTNTSPEIKISHNAEQATPSEKNTSQTVEIKDKQIKKTPYLEQNISNHKLDRFDQNKIPKLQQK